MPEKYNIASIKKKKKTCKTSVILYFCLLLFNISF